jgi:hypothetical protein
MRDAGLPYQPKPVKEVMFPNIDFCQKWISYGFDIVTMLANSCLHHPVSALPKLCRKKKLREKKLERFNCIIDCLYQTERRWFVFRGCGWHTLLLRHILERNSSAFAPNITVAAYSYRMTM